MKYTLKQAIIYISCSLDHFVNSFVCRIIIILETEQLYMDFLRPWYDSIILPLQTIRLWRGSECRASYFYMDNFFVLHVLNVTIGHISEKLNLMHTTRSMTCYTCKSYNL